MFKRKNKKTGIETPEFRKSTPPPPPPTSGSNAHKPNPNYVPPASVKPQYDHPSPIPANDIKYSNRQHKHVSAFLVGTAECLDKFMAEHEDIVQIKNDGVYWSIKDGTLGIVTTQEWVDYFNRRSNIIPNAKEN